jgi:nucleoside-diphosphate-sugar epimerase
MRPYNVGGDEALSIAALAKRTAALAGGVSPVRVDADGPDGRDYVPDLKRSGAELGLSNRVGLDDALARTIAWARGQRSPLRSVALRSLPADIAT